MDELSFFNPTDIEIIKEGKNYILKNNFTCSDILKYSWEIFVFPEQNEKVFSVYKADQNTVKYTLNCNDTILRAKAWVHCGLTSKKGVWAHEFLFHSERTIQPPKTVEDFERLLAKDHTLEYRIGIDIVGINDLLLTFPALLENGHFDWEFSVDIGRSLCSRLTSLKGLCMCISCKVGCQKVSQPFICNSKEFALNLIKSFIYKFIDIVYQEDDLIWHDDAVARRVIVMCNAYIHWRNDMNADYIYHLKRSLSGHAKLLESQNMYKPNHNHGMYRDYALAIYSFLFCDDEPNCTLYLKLAKTRAIQYFEYVATADGVVKEHSPQYQMHIYKVLQWMNDNYTDEIFNKICKKLWKFSLNIVMPNGLMPSIGDSAKIFYHYLYTDNNSEYVYARTSGEYGLAPRSKSAFFPQGGYAIMRSSWSDKKDGTYILLTAATHSMAHKHNDDLNFIIYHKGDLIVEAGNRNYNYSEPYTKFIYSSYAHNVLLIDDKPLAVKTHDCLPYITERDKLTRITSCGDDGIHAYADAESYRWEYVKQIRTIDYDREKKLIEISDILESEKICKATLIYHLSDEVDIVQVTHQENTTINCYRNDTIVASITASADCEFTQTIIEGEGEPPYFTYIFEGENKPRYGKLIKLDIPLRIGTYTVTLEIKLK